MERLWAEVTFGHALLHLFAASFGNIRALVESTERGWGDKAKEGAPDDQTSPG
jgi:hypothetical protein